MASHGSGYNPRKIESIVHDAAALAGVTDRMAVITL